MGLIIEGLDVATSCGFARIERPGSLASSICGAFHSEGANAEDKAGLLAIFLRNRYGPRGLGKPDFVAVEMPLRNVVMHRKKKGKGKPSLIPGGAPATSINPNALQLSALAGATTGILDAFGIPWGLISSATWRSVYYGKGYAPPIKIINHNDGSTTEEDDWKQAAINEARQQRVSLPGDKIAQGDAAEALAIAVCWERCTFIPERHQAAFMALRTGQARAA